MASKPGRKRAWSEDDLKAIWEQYAEGGYEAVEKANGFTYSHTRNLVRRARLLHEAPKPQAKAKRRGSKPTPMALSKAVGRFIEDCQAKGLNGKSHAVSLGALPGFPAATTDPKIVAKAIEHYEGKITAEPMGIIRELKLRQRIMDLRGAIEWLSYEPAEDTDRATFIAWGAEWATEHGISYGAFREMGVPAEVLREAGITRAQ